MFLKFYLIIFLKVLLFIPERIVESENVTILFVYEDKQDIAQKSVEAALKYINKNASFNLQVNIKKVVGLKNNSDVMLNSLCETYDEMITSESAPHIVLDTTNSGLISETVKYFTLSLGLPTISSSCSKPRIWRNISVDEEKYLLHISPPADIVTDVIKAFVLELNYINVCILYDQNFVMDHKLKTILQNINARHLIIPLNLAELDKQLENLEVIDISSIFILGGLKTVKTVLDTASQIDFLNRRYKWNILTLSDGEIQCDCQNSTIMLVQPDFKEYKNFEIIKNIEELKEETNIMSVFYFDLTILTILTVRDMLIKNVWPADMQHLTCKQFNNQSNLIRNNLDVEKYLNTSFLADNTYLSFKMDKNGQSQVDFNMDISAITFQNSVLKKVEKFGLWRSEFNLNISLRENASEIVKSHAYSRYYRIVTKEQKPYIYIDKTVPGGYRGYCIDLLEEIITYYNFTYEIRLIKDDRFGSVNEKGEWDGIVRELIDDKADIGLGAIRVTPDRKSVIDFTLPIGKGVGFTLLMKKHLPSQSMFKFFLAMDSGVWLGLLITYLFTSSTIWIFDRYSPCSYQNIRKHKKLENKRLFTFGESLWFCITSLTPQGGGESPINLSGKLITATWWLFGFIIIQSYTANLASFLAVSYDSSINSVHDLANQYQISYAPVQGSQAMRHFETLAYVEQTFFNIWQDMNLDDSLPVSEKYKLSIWEYPLSTKYIRMWESMKQNGLANDTDEAVQRVRDSRSETDGFAFIGDSIELSYLSLVNCDLVVVDDEMAVKPLGIAVQKNSPLKDRLNYAIMDLMGKRKMEALYQKWWKYNPDALDCPKQSIIADGIHIHDVLGMFILIFSGVLLVILAVFVRFQIKKHNLIHIAKEEVKHRKLYFQH